MSDMQDLIHTNAHNAYAIGVRTERQRIIEMLEENKMHYGCAYDCPQPCDAPSFFEFIALIKGESE
jgi:hypothetical protein